MKKLIGILLIALFTVACGQTGSAEEEMTVVSIATLNETHREVLEDVSDRLEEKENITLDVVMVSDYVQPNVGVADGSLDMNGFQFMTFLAEYNNSISDESNKILPIGYGYITPLGLWASDDIQSLEDIPQGASVAVPNDPVNIGNSIKNLEKAGLITLSDKGTKLPTEDDIVENPLKLEIIPLANGQVARSIPDTDLMMTSSTVAVDAGYTMDEAIYIEDPETTSDLFQIILGVRADNIDNETYQKVVAEYQTEETAQVMEEVSGGTMLTNWEEAGKPLEDYEQYVEENY